MKADELCVDQRQLPGMYFVGVPVQLQVNDPAVVDVGVSVTVTACPTVEVAPVRVIFPSVALTVADEILPVGATLQPESTPV